MRGPDGEITGLYTLVSPKMRWPNAIAYWEYDAELNNFSEIYYLLTYFDHDLLLIDFSLVKF